MLNLMLLSNKTEFAVKDPGHYSKIKVLVGNEQESYNSYAKVNFTKKPNKVSPGTKNNTKDRT